MKNPEDEFILGFLPVLRKYLSYKKIDTLDKQLDLLESQLQSLRTLSNDASFSTFEEVKEEYNSESSQEENNYDDDSNDKLVFDITFYDLKEDVQRYVSEALGYENVDELLKNHPHLEGPVCSFEI